MGAGDEPRSAAQRAMAEHGRALAAGIEAALGGWVQRSVTRVLAAQGRPAGPDVLAAAHREGQRARAELGPRVRTALAADAAATANPLAIVREAVPYPTRVLAEAGATAVARDPRQEALFPDDPYDLTPAAFADLDESLAEPGIAWGLARAGAARKAPDQVAADQEGAGREAADQVAPGRETPSPAPPGTTGIVAFTPDLLDRSKLGAAAGERVRFVSRPEQLGPAAAGAAVVVVDLVRPGALEAVQALPAPVRSRTVAYANHTRRELLDAAAAAGCAGALARSAFFGDLGRHLGLGPAPGDSGIAEPRSP